MLSLENRSKKTEMLSVFKVAQTRQPSDNCLTTTYFPIKVQTGVKNCKPNKIHIIMKLPRWVKPKNMLISIQLLSVPQLRSH